MPGHWNPRRERTTPIVHCDVGQRRVSEEHGAGTETCAPGDLKERPEQAAGRGARGRSYLVFFFAMIFAFSASLRFNCLLFRPASPGFDRLPKAIPLHPEGLEMLAALFDFLFDQVFNPLLFEPIDLVVEKAAEMGGSQPQEIGCQSVEFVVVHDLFEPALQPEFGHLIAVDIHLARYSRLDGHLVEAGRCQTPTADDVLEVDVGFGSPGKVVDALPGFIGPAAEVPGFQAQDNRPLHQDLEVRGVGVVADQLGLVVTQGFEEITDHLVFGDFLLVAWIVGQGHQCEDDLTTVHDSSLDGGDRDDTAKCGLEKRRRVFVGGAALIPHHPHDGAIVPDVGCLLRVQQPSGQRVGNPLHVEGPYAILHCFEHRFIVSRVGGHGNTLEPQRRRERKGNAEGGGAGFNTEGETIWVISVEKVKKVIAWSGCIVPRLHNYFLFAMISASSASLRFYFLCVFGFIFCGFAGLGWLLMSKGILSRLNASSQQASIKVEDLGDGITAFRLHSRWTRMLGFEVSFYRVGDLLVDTGFVHARSLVLQALENATISAICCTHHHEDHTGNAGALAERHGCPVFIYQPEHLETEGLDRLLPYRRLFWGMPVPFRADSMNERVVGRSAEFEVIPAAGHSQTHVALFEPVSRTVFVGDLFVTPGASGVMTHENPYLLVESLRRVAALEPRRMLTGHGRDVHDPVGPLKGKADAIERAAAESQRLIEEGVHPRTVVRRVFPNGRQKDRILEILTQGEFSRLNFVRAAVKHGRAKLETGN